MNNDTLRNRNTLTNSNNNDTLTNSNTRVILTPIRILPKIVTVPQIIILQ